VPIPLHSFPSTQEDHTSASLRLTRIATALFALALLLTPAFAQQDAPQALPQLCSQCVRDNLSYLAGPALHGRGSGTEDEHHAAEFIARKLQQYGLQPAAENGEYIQTVTLRSRGITGTPMLSFGGDPASKFGATLWAHGRDVSFLRMPQPESSGPLQKINLAETTAPPPAVPDGAAIALMLKPSTTSDQLQQVIAPFRQSKASIVMVSAGPELHGLFKSRGAHPPRTGTTFGDEPPAPSPALVLVGPTAFTQIWNSPDGSPVRVDARFTPWQETPTWNVLAKLPGQDESQNEIVLLTAHLDHLGVVKGKTYPGADDDASGTATVMELARALAQGPKPRRTIVAALWGSEEAGLIGSRYFLQHPTFPLKNIVANLEFEMVARGDPAVKPDQLWLTGWDRSNLGPELAAHGANLVPDPHPSENFFQRSDNYALAEKGIVAQTVSSFGLHKDYHQPGDTLEKVDWGHLDDAINSMIAPLTWLANSTFTPAWKPGGQP
jgi:hypothetical protein